MVSHVVDCYVWRDALDSRLHEGVQPLQKLCHKRVTLHNDVNNMSDNVHV
jgi:hypothetical protein